MQQATSDQSWHVANRDQAIGTLTRDGATDAAAVAGDVRGKRLDTGTPVAARVLEEGAEADGALGIGQTVGAVGLDTGNPLPIVVPAVVWAKAEQRG
jgi:hypothetical protein